MAQHTTCNNGLMVRSKRSGGESAFPRLLLSLSRAPGLAGCPRSVACTFLVAGEPPPDLADRIGAAVSASLKKEVMPCPVSKLKTHGRGSLGTAFSGVHGSSSASR